MMPRGGYGNILDNPEHRRRAQQVFVDRATNDVILRLHETDIVRVRPNGDVILSTGGWATHKTLNGMNDALELFDMWVEARDNQPPRGNWQVYDIDGTIIPYTNNKVNYIITINATGEDAHNRCRWLAEAFNVPYAPRAPAGQARIVSAPPRPVQQTPAAILPAAVPQRTANTGPAALRPAAAATPPAASAVPRPATLAAPPRQQGAGSWANIAASGLKPAATAAARAPAGPQAATRLTGPGLAASSNASSAPAVPAVAAPQALGTSPGNSSLRALDVARQKLAKPVEEQLAEHMTQLGIGQEELEDDAHTCVVCMEEPRTIVLVPCGHMALCKDCCEAIIVQQGKECPLCCQPVQYHVEVDG